MVGARSVLYEEGSNVLVGDGIEDWKEGLF